MRLECVPTERAGAGKKAQFIRVKDYIAKPEVVDHFTPVYDVASRITGCTWAQANKVALCDTVGCNLDCFYCYQQGRSTESEEVSVDDIENAFRETAMDSPVWRVSGGEPLLQRDCEELLYNLTSDTNHLVMLNTNGVEAVEFAADPRLLVEVSIKGLCDEWASWVTKHGGLLEKQFDTIEQYEDDGHMLMFNVVCLAPEGTHYEEALLAARDLRDRLASIDETFPLRATPVVAKRYDWCPEWPAFTDHKAAWEEAIVERYGWLNALSPKASFLGIRG